MAERSRRLQRLVKLQEQIKSLHELKHAQHLAQAGAAEKDTSELLEALNATTPMPGLFPDLYNRKIASAIDRQRHARELASAEAARLATAHARTNMATRAYEDALRLEERADSEREQLERIERGNLGEK
jgi:hypothetical protein